MSLKAKALIIVAIWLGAAHAQDKTLALAYIGEFPAGVSDSPKYLKVFEEAMALAIDLRRKEFQALGCNLTIRFYRNRGTGLESLRSTEEALKGDTLAAVGYGSSDEAMVAVDRLEGTSYVVLSPFATSDDLLKHYPKVMMLSAPNSLVARALETFVKARYPRKKIAAVVPWDSAFARNFYEVLSPSFQKKVRWMKVPEKILNLSKIVSETLASKPEVILLPTFPVLTAILIRALVHGGYRGVFVGPDSWGEGPDSPIHKLAGDVAFEGYMIREVANVAPGDTVSELNKALTQRTGMPVPPQALTYFDGTNYFLDIFHDLGCGATRAQVAREVRKRKKYQGVESTYCFSSLECPERKFGFFSVKNGKYSAGKEFEVR